VILAHDDRQPVFERGQRDPGWQRWNLHG
jgi:hypothetical protein